MAALNPSGTISQDEVGMGFPYTVASDADFADGDFAPGASGFVIWRGGDFQLTAEATTWGGATLTVTSLGPKQSNWLGLTEGGVELTANGSAVFGVPSGARLRCEISGGDIEGLTLVLGRMPA